MLHVDAPLKVTTGKPEVSGMSLVWRYVRSDVGKACNGDDKYPAT